MKESTRQFLERIETLLDSGDYEWAEETQWKRLIE